MSMSAGELQGQGTQPGTETPSSSQGSQQAPQQQGGQPQFQQQQQFSPQQQQGQQDNSYAATFLQSVPEGARPLLEPYIRQWDAGVTQRFQQLQGSLQPYEQIGSDPETLAAAYQLYELLDENPVGLLQFLVNEMKGDPQFAPQLAELFGGQQQQQQPQQFQQPPPQQFQQQPQFSQGQPQPFFPQQQQQQQGFQGLPPEFQQEWQRNNQLLQTLAQGFLQQQQAQQEAAEDAQLDTYLSGLKQKYGDFDEDFVLAKMQAGADGEQAVQAFKQLTQGQVNGALQNQLGAPTVLSGGGSPPAQTPQKLKDVSSKDIRGLVAGLVQQASQQDQG